MERKNWSVLVKIRVNGIKFTSLVYNKESKGHYLQYTINPSYENGSK